MLRAIGFCEYGPDEFGDIFPGYERYNIDFVYSCIYADTCKQCVDENIDEQLIEIHAQQQDRIECPQERRGFVDYTRGCVYATKDKEGQPMCCYSGAFISECRLE